MGPEPSAAFKVKARRAYERGRVRHAIWAASPTLAVAIVAGLMSDRTASAAFLAAALYGLSVLFYWRGRHLARGVLPGIAAGLMPFAAAHAARVYGHLCTPQGCTSICVPACLAGGFVAGAALTRLAWRSERLRASWVPAYAVASLTGSLGCVCIGFGGVLALAAGLLVGTAPLALRHARSG